MTLTLTLAVADLTRTEAFYREVLGLDITWQRPRPDLPPVLILRYGNGTILFRERAVLQARHPAIFEHLDRHPCGTGLSLDFEVEDLALCHRAVDRRRLHTLYELQDDETGWQELWLYDPDGYLVTLSSRP